MRFALVVLLLPTLLLACGGEPAPTAGPEAEGGGAATDPEFRPLDGSGATPSKPPPVLSREEVQQQFLAGVEKKMLSTDEEDRLIAIEMLLEGKQKQRAGQLISKLLMDPSEDVRATAAQALGLLDFKAGISGIRTMLSRETYAPARKQGLNTLYILGGIKVVPDLVKALKEDEDGYVRTLAADLLAKSKSPDAVDPLIAVLEEEFDAQVRLSLVSALNRLKAKKAAPIVMDSLEDANELVRIESAKALASFGDKAAIGKLVDALDMDEGSNVLVAVTAALTKLTGVPNEYDADSPVEEREAALKAWQDWWEENREE